MTKTLNVLAVQYAQALVEYNSLRMHVEDSKNRFGYAHRSDEFELREATDNLYNAQEALNAEAVRVAEKV